MFKAILHSILFYIIVYLAVFPFGRLNILKSDDYNLTAIISFLISFIPIIFYLRFRYIKLEEQEILKLKIDLQQNLEQKILDLPENLIYKGKLGNLISVSVVLFFTLQILSLAYAFVAAFSKEVNPQSYWIGWLVAVIGFVVWVVLKIKKNSKVVVSPDIIEIYETDLFLRSKVSKFSISDLKKISKNYVSVSRGQLAYTVGLHFTKDFIPFPFNISPTELQCEQIIADLTAFKSKNKFNFEIRNDESTRLNDKYDESIKNSLRVTGLIVLYFAIILIFAFLF